MVARGRSHSWTPRNPMEMLWGMLYWRRGERSSAGPHGRSHGLGLVGEQRRGHHQAMGWPGGGVTIPEELEEL